MDSVFFDVQGVAIGYGRPLLNDISFRIERGDYWGIFGPNGAGKTTLIKVLLGALSPLSGRIRSPEDLRLGYVPQLTALCDSLPLTVRKILQLGSLDLRNPPDPSETLERLGLRHLEGKLFADLSGGQRQLAIVARALHRNPDILVLDEPTSGVDLPTRYAIGDLLQKRHEEGMTILLITHLLAEIGPEVNRFLWLDSVQDLFLCGNREEVLQSPRLREAYGASLRIADVDGRPVITWCNTQGEAP